MDRINKNFCFHDSLLEVVKYGEKDSVPIDQQPAQSFNIDPMTGRPMSDITAILRAKGSEQNNLLSNLEEFKADYLPEGISDADALKYYKPRLCQLPSELAEYSEKVTSERLEEAKKAKELAEQEELFKKLEEEAKKKEEEPKS